jgi:sulfur carrier protein ThiS
MTVQITLRDKKYEVEPGLTVRKAIQKLGLTPESYLAVRQGEMITEDTILKDGDQIKLVAVISGGER